MMIGQVARPAGSDRYQSQLLELRNRSRFAATLSSNADLSISPQKGATKVSLKMRMDQLTAAGLLPSHFLN